MDTVTAGGGSLGLVAPSWVFPSWGGRVFTAQAIGTGLVFGNTRPEHPTLSREDRAHNPSQYRNIVFSPIVQPIYGAT